MEATTSYARRRPGGPLAGLVTEMTGFDLDQAGVHLGLPSGSLTLIVPIMPTVVSGPVRAAADSLLERPTSFHGLVGGLHTRAVQLHPGRQAGLQLAVTPAGARALFGLPAGECAGRVLALDLLAPRLAGLSERLAALPDWDARFDLLERVLLPGLDVDAARQARDRSPQTWQAWRLLARSRGRAGVQEVADAVGWSRRHLAARFQAEFGHPPKTVATLLRFEHSRALLDTPGLGLAEVAAAAGFADQAHLTRTWRTLTGYSPTGWRRAETPPLS